ncbi:MAG: dienelactone hydrolase family protein, partial [Ideonella sp.]
MTTPAHLQNNNTGPFSTQPWSGRQQIDAGHYTIERVTYKSQGTEIVGNAFVPKVSGRNPAVVVIGPVAYVKEQSPMQYASRLVREGYVALAFDPRHHGESGGEPRRLESRRAKVEDLRASIDYLVRRPDVDPQQIHVVGVCQGANWAIEASTLDPRVKALGLVAGHYLMPEVAALYLGSTEKVAERLARAKAAREAFDESGELRYIPVVSATDPQALLTAPVIREFYERWAYRGAFWNFH